MKLRTEKEKAIAAVREEVVSLSVLAASKVLGKEISEEDNRALIEETIAKAGEGDESIDCSKALCIALFELAQQKNKLASIEEEFRELKKCFQDNKEFGSYFTSPKLSLAQEESNYLQTFFKVQIRSLSIHFMS